MIWRTSVPGGTYTTEGAGCEEVTLGFLTPGVSTPSVLRVDGGVDGVADESVTALRRGRDTFSWIIIAPCPRS